MIISNVKMKLMENGNKTPQYGFEKLSAFNHETHGYMWRSVRLWSSSTDYQKDQNENNVPDWSCLQMLPVASEVLPDKWASNPERLFI